MCLRELVLPQPPGPRHARPHATSGTLVPTQCSRQSFLLPVPSCPQLLVLKSATAGCEKQGACAKPSPPRPSCCHNGSPAIAAAAPPCHHPQPHKSVICLSTYALLSCLTCIGSISPHSFHNFLDSLYVAKT